MSERLEKATATIDKEIGEHKVCLADYDDVCLFGNGCT